MRPALRRVPGEARGSGALASALARAGWPPSVVAGVRMALARPARLSPVPVRATLVAAILAVGVSAAALTFAASLQHLLETPRLYGDLELERLRRAVDRLRDAASHPRRPGVR